MKLPRLTNIWTVDIHLRGGTVITKRFYRLEWSGTGSNITTLKWVCVPPESFYVAVDDIAAINIRSRKMRIVFREKEI